MLPSPLADLQVKFLVPPQLHMDSIHLYQCYAGKILNSATGFQLGILPVLPVLETQLRPDLALAPTDLKSVLLLLEQCRYVATTIVAVTPDPILPNASREFRNLRLSLPARV